MKKLWTSIFILLLSVLSYPLEAADNKEPPSIKIGALVTNQLYPVRTKEELHQTWQTITNDLTQSTGVRFIFRGYDSMESLMHDLSKGKIGVAYVKSVPTSILVKKHGHIKRIATAITKDPSSGEKDTTYSSYILVAKDSSINSLNDLKNKTLAYYDPYSASNYLKVKEKLNQLGVSVTWLKVASLDEAYKAVENNQAAAVGVWEYLYHQFNEKNKFKIIGEISGIQHPSILINTQVVSPEVAAKVIQELNKIKIHNIVDYKVHSEKKNPPKDVPAQKEAAQ
ncbi:phosphate/phosphite/phosphonate ABC transporter substrate-binding protein [Legionella impletisoli]|uniref:ABC transporter, phosphonate, periplasmic substrate-binding protein n=1 Tax=Legionella impletisoli TaxID=343510 RepID=A0A917NE66_9GAMM|nr:PhnD/SsuA/transferrin family substrate-binding protein [Legionella impletisoli]GGI91999.1 hypothetical protein GCM10007966_20840 [Legionella impletisoli]